MLQFLRSGEEGCEELETYIKKIGIWEDVSGLNLASLSKLVKDEMFDKKTLAGLFLNYPLLSDRVNGEPGAGVKPAATCAAFGSPTVFI